MDKSHKHDLKKKSQRRFLQTLADDPVIIPHDDHAFDTESSTTPQKGLGTVLFVLGWILVAILVATFFPNFPGKWKSSFFSGLLNFNFPVAKTVWLPLAD